MQFTSNSCQERNWQNEDGSTQVNNAEMLHQDKADLARLNFALADDENYATVGHNGDQEDDDDHAALDGLGDDDDIVSSRSTVLFIFSRET